MFCCCKTDDTTIETTASISVSTTKDDEAPAPGAEPLEEVVPEPEEAAPEVAPEPEPVPVESPPEPKRKQYTIDLSRETGQKLGLVIGERTLEPGRGFIREVKPGGLAEKWNVENPDTPFNKDCELVSLNGMTAYAEMADEVSKQDINKLVFVLLEPDDTTN
mmetsp:Transcript_45424/g.105378  ORF Transcript_45424/g.105378 Transcript_45424/m.105378 type:complete len:162 (+) Transcript_45424:93-578(+)